MGRILSCCQSAVSSADLRCLRLWLTVWPDPLVPTAWAAAIRAEISPSIRVTSEQHFSLIRNSLIPTNLIFYTSLHILLDYCRAEAASKGFLKLSWLVCLCQSNWLWSLGSSSDSAVRSSNSTDQSWVLQSKIKYTYKQNSPYLFCSNRMHSDLSMDRLPGWSFTLSVLFNKAIF